jgi:hypothetical protein
MIRSWRHPIRPVLLTLGLGLITTLALMGTWRLWRGLPALALRAKAASERLSALPALPPQPKGALPEGLAPRLKRMQALGVHAHDEATRLLALLERGLPAGGRLRDLQWDPATPEDQLLIEWRGEADAGALAELLEASGAYAHVALEQEPGPQGSQRSALRLQR